MTRAQVVWQTTHINTATVDLPDEVVTYWEANTNVIQDVVANVDDAQIEQHDMTDCDIVEVVRETPEPLQHETLIDSLRADWADGGLTEFQRQRLANVATETIDAALATAMTARGGEYVRMLDEIRGHATRILLGMVDADGSVR